MDPAATYILIASSVVAVSGAYCMRRMAAERREKGEFARLTAFLIWAIYLSFTALTVCIAWLGVWAMPLPQPAAAIAGAAALVFGVALVAGGMRAFRSVARISGRDHAKLIRQGAYRWTRNPQNVGWGAALVGAALLGRSGLALAFAAVFLLVFRLYLPAEERHMEKCYGEAWRRYRDATPRFFGVPTKAAADQRATRPASKPVVIESS